jgi:hypothetical protein
VAQTPPVPSQEAAISAVREAGKLLHDPTLADVVGRYDRLDRDLTVFEQYLPKAVRAFDAMVERQIDAARER